MGTEYIAGDFNAECPVCGFEVKGSRLKRRWDNLWVCPGCYDYRNPQDFLRAMPENNAVHNPAPKTTPLYRDAGMVLDSDGVPIYTIQSNYPLMSEGGSNA